MRMLNPSCGECADRITILWLKIQNAKKKNVDYAHFSDELHAVEEYATKLLANSPSTTKEDYRKFANELRDVNANLWKLEDDIRIYVNKKELTTDDKTVVVDIALLIPVLNDQRAELVRKISGLASGKEESSEKVY